VDRCVEVTERELQRCKSVHHCVIVASHDIQRISSGTGC